MAYLTSRPVLLLAASALATQATSCGEDNFNKGAAGVARVTASSTAALIRAILEDDRCGFAATSVTDAVVVTGEEGSLGAAVYTVRACALDFEADPVVFADCENRETKLFGRVTVTATMSFAGTVTGDRESPVIPRRSDAMTIRLSSAVLDQFAVSFPGADGKLTFREGTLEATAHPALAVTNPDGVCTAPTHDMQLTGVRYTDGNAFLETSEESSHLFVLDSDISAQIGKGPGGENTYSGMVNLLGTKVSLPPEGETAELDTEYARASFEAGFVCEHDFQMPIDYECAGTSADEKAGQAIARLSIQTLGAIAALIEEDESCGFASPNVLADRRIVGQPGDNGRAVKRTSGCVIDKPTAVVALEDCQGNKTRVTGRITVDAEQTFTGLVTGDPDAPIAPTSDAPVVNRFTRIALDELRVEIESDTSSAATTVTFLTGILAADITPRFAVGDTEGLCSVPTGIARFDGVGLDDARVTVADGDTRLTYVVDSADFDALAGTWDNATNELTGQITITGTQHTLPVDPADPGLVPDYDEDAFTRGWACEGELAMPVSHTCDPTGTMADGIARLTPQVFATVVSLITSDTSCGFASSNVMARHVGDEGSEGTRILTLQSPCALRFEVPTLANEDCHDLKTYVSGVARVSGTQQIQGFLTSATAALPTSRDSVEYELSLDMDRFEVWTSSDTPRVEVVEGTLSGIARPRSALDESLGACVLGTPVIELENMRYTDATVSVKSSSSAFALEVVTSSLAAQIGTKGSVSNTYTGTVALRNRRVSVPVDPSESGLDPSYDEDHFTASYTCDANLHIPASDTECSFRGVLAPQVARLLVQNVATASGLVLGDQQCGFRSQMAAPVAAFPPAANQPPTPPDPGFVTTGINSCTVALPMGVSLPEDCFRSRTFTNGSATMTATMTTSGLRTEQCQGPFCVQLAIPVSRDAIEMTVSEGTFNDFASFTLQPGQQAPQALLTIVEGRLGFVFAPLLGANTNQPNPFVTVHDVQTPVSRVSRIEVLERTRMSVDLEGRRFDIEATAGRLDAFIGRYEGQGNFVRGSLRIDGQDIPLPSVDLLPTYNQELFDQSYDCTPNLRETIPPN